MSQQQSNGGPIIIAILCLMLYWLSASPKLPDPEPQPPAPELVDQVASMQATFEQPSEQPAKKPEIVIFTRPNCPPCDRWKQIEQPKFEKAGWVVAYCDQHDFVLTPHFIFEVNGRAYEHKGYLPFEKIDEVTK